MKVARGTTSWPVGVAQTSLWAVPGFDLASYADAAGGLAASLINPSSNSGDAKGDTYSQIEGLAGSDYGDRLTGNDGVNLLSGGGGNDTLLGLNGTDTLNGGNGNDVLWGGNQNDKLDGEVGNDTLIGGNGYDTLIGGSGADSFVLEFPRSGSDKIIDFTHGTDTIALSSSFGVDDLHNINFISGETARDATTTEPTLIYNEATGSLLWDADGAGWRSVTTIATLENHEHLSLSDFVII